MSSGFEGVPDSSVLQFAEALSGGRGALDAWLEVNNEADVRAHVEAYAEKRSRQLAEERAELLVLVREIVEGRGHCFIPTDDPSRPTFNWDERADAAISNATQRKEPGA